MNRTTQTVFEHQRQQRKQTRGRYSLPFAAPLLGALVLTLATAVPALDEEAAAESIWTNAVAMDTMWTLVAGFLVFFMNAGFGFVEAGFCRAKNATNILGKNFVVFFNQFLV